MSGHKWKQDEGDNLHPEENLLLAYIRQQLSADASHEVYQHLAICEPCRRQHATLLLRSGLVYSMPPYDPSVADMLEKQRIDSPAAAKRALQQRQRVALRQDITLGWTLVLFFLSKVLGVQGQNAKKPASTTIAIRSVPLVGIAVLIISILLVVAFVLAFTLSKHILVPGNFPGGSQIATPPVILTQITIQSKPTATPMATLTQGGNTPGPGTTAKVTPTGTTPGAARPFVKVCSTSAELAQSLLHICGYNFKPGDRIMVSENVPGIGTRPKSVIIADANGSFSVVWTITNCRTVPDYIFAEDIVHRYMTPSVAVTVTLGTCYAPTPIRVK